MAGKYLLGVDVGTTSVKVAVIDENAGVLGISKSSYNLITPEPDYQQIDTEDMWRAFLKCVELVSEGKGLDLSQIAGIGISSLCPGLAAFGEDGEVLVDPILYSDRRSTEEAEIILSAVGSDKLFEITVNTLMALRMTGRYAIDYSNASYSNFFETAGGFKWSSHICDKVGIDMEKLPPLLHSTDVVGGLINQELIGMGLKQGTPVVIGGGDTACASLAVGVTRNGDVCESVGTTNVLTICVDQPKFDHGFINRCHVVDGTWIYQGAMSHTGAAYQWFKDEFCKDLQDESELTHQDVFIRMNEEAAKAKPGCGGLVFLPYMLGERSPVWDPYARGVFFGISLHTTRKDFNRAIMEGCGYGLRQLAEIAGRVTGKHIGEFVSIGGGAKSEVWAQIKADIMGVNIKVLDLNDMAPIGAALLAGVGAGCFADVYEASAKVERKVCREVTASHSNDDVYERGYRVYTELYPRIKDLYKITSNLH